jgi:hypothetical protein
VRRDQRHARPHDARSGHLPRRHDRRVRRRAKRRILPGPTRGNQRPGRARVQHVERLDHLQRRGRPPVLCAGEGWLCGRARQLPPDGRELRALEQHGLQRRSAVAGCVLQVPPRLRDHGSDLDRGLAARHRHRAVSGGRAVLRYELRDRLDRLAGQLR